MEAIPGSMGIAKFDLSLTLSERPSGIRGWLNYNTDLFDASTILRMLGHFQVLLEGIVTDPDQQVSVLPLLTEAEERQLLVDWNDTATEYRRDRSAFCRGQYDAVPGQAAVGSRLAKPMGQSAFEWPGKFLLAGDERAAIEIRGAAS